MNGEVQMYTKMEKEPEIYLCIQVVTRNEVMIIFFDDTHIFLTFCRLLYYEKFYLLPEKKLHPLKKKIIQDTSNARVTLFVFSPVSELLSLLTELCARSEVK